MRRLLIIGSLILLNVQLSMAQCSDDMDAPTFVSCPQDTCILLPPGATATYVEWELPEVLDNCSAASDINLFSNGYLPPNGIFSLGVTPVEYLASDEAGNLSAACSFNVTLKASTDLTFYPDTSDYRVNGNRIDIPIRALNFEDIFAFQFTINVMDGNLLDSIGLIQNPDNPDPLTWNSINNHVMEVNWMSQIPQGRTIDDGTVVCLLRIFLNANTDICKSIKFVDEPVQRMAVLGNGLQVLPMTIDRDLCAGPLVSIGGRIETFNSIPLDSVEVSCTGVPITYTNEEGMYRFDSLTWLGDYILSPYSNNQPLNGVNVADLVLIRDHILGAALLNNPFERIAADVDASQRLTIVDLVLISQLILGYAQELPVPSWEFVPQNFPLVLPAASDSVPTYSSLAFLQNVPQNQPNRDFYGVKMGDVNQTVTFSLDEESPILLHLQNRTFRKGEELVVNFSIPDNVEAFQLELKLDPRQLIAVANDSNDKIDKVPSAKVDRSRNSIRLLYLKEIHDGIQLKLKARADGSLDESMEISTALGIDKEKTQRPVHLSFAKPFEVGIKGTAFIQPNPFQSNCQLNLELQEEGTILLELFDSKGTRLYHQQQYFSKGSGTWPLDATLFPSKGIYFYRLSAKQMNTSGKLIKH